MSLSSSAPNQIIAFNKGDPLFQFPVKPSLKFVTYDSISKYLVALPPNTVFLGRDEREGAAKSVNYFAIDATGCPMLLEHLETVGEFLPMRPHALNLANEEAAILSEARPLLDWNSRNLHCPMCGSVTVSDNSGWKRKCEFEECKTKSGKENVSFPRTDPVIIVAVISPDQKSLLLGRQAVWPAGMYSCVAGFFEPGESLEEAVAREVMEETNIRVTDVRYHSSQPWPFPSQVIFGCIAQATTLDIGLVDMELEAANWFPIEQVKDAMDGRNDALKLPNTYSISYKLIEHIVKNRSKL